MLSVRNHPYILSVTVRNVIRLSVVMLSVVAHLKQLRLILSKSHFKKACHNNRTIQRYEMNLWLIKLFIPKNGSKMLLNVNVGATTISCTTLRKKDLSIRTLSIRTLSIRTLSIRTLSIRTLSTRTTTNRRT
jgi:hypothetical protein